MNRGNSRPYIFGTLSGFFLIGFFLNIQYVVVPNVLGEAMAYSEYLDLSVYFFDLLFIAALFCAILYNKTILASIREVRLFHVKQTEKIYLCLPILLLFVILTSILFSSYALLSIRHAFLFIEAVGLYYIIVLGTLFHVKQSAVSKNIVSRETAVRFAHSFFTVVIFFALFNSILAIIQFCTGSSVGMKLLGESKLVLGQSDVATLTILGSKILRGYGLFLHPNILASFLAVAIFLSLSIKKLEVSRETVSDHKDLFHVKPVVLMILFVGLLVTFSKIAILSLFLVTIILASIDSETVSRETCSKLFRFLKYFAFVIALFVFALYFVQGKSYFEREVGLLIYSQTTTQTLLGQGIGTIFTEIPIRYISSSSPWLLQPIHNIFLVFFHEIGVVGLFMIIFFTLRFYGFDRKTQMFHGEHSILEKVSMLLVSIVLFVGITDHFMATIPQGIFIFWTSMGVAVAMRLYYIDNSV